MPIHHQPIIITDSEHGIDQHEISANTLKVLNKLHDAGYDAYLVGGAVRDLLLGKKPKDFDVATSADPDEVKKVFRNCRLIGRRFRLAHVFFGRDVIEVATFRGVPSQLSDDEGMIKRDNCYGTIEEDALRRDFTINGLYYRAHDQVILDYVEGYEDIKQGIVRLMGDAETRYREDPVRMLRAVRFAIKLDFQIEDKTQGSIQSLSDLLANIPAARLYEEVLKLFACGDALNNFNLLREYHLFQYLFPGTEDVLTDDSSIYPYTFIQQALINTDQRIRTGSHINPAFLMAVFLWEAVCQKWQCLQDVGEDDYPALQQACAETLTTQIKSVSIPKRHSMRMKDIWFMQYRFDNRRGKRASRLLENPAFRAAYDFLLLRAEAGHADQDLADWWTEFQTLDEADQRKKVQDTYGDNKKRRSRRRSTRRSQGN